MFISDEELKNIYSEAYNLVNKPEPISKRLDEFEGFVKGILQEEAYNLVLSEQRALDLKSFERITAIYSSMALSNGDSYQKLKEMIVNLYRCKNPLWESLGKAILNWRYCSFLKKECTITKLDNPSFRKVVSVKDLISNYINHLFYLEGYRILDVSEDYKNVLIISGLDPSMK